MWQRIGPFEGWRGYDLSQCLKMTLDARGDGYTLPFLECVSTQAFGFIYQRYDGAGGPAYTGFEYDRALIRALHLLGYPFALQFAPTPELALGYLREALRAGPALVGPMDAGFLSYHPDAHARQGVGHALVVQALDAQQVVVHDPDGFVAVGLPLGDFLVGWQAERLLPPANAYPLWQIGLRTQQPNLALVCLQALELALQNLTQPAVHLRPDYAVLYGSEAMRQFAQDVAFGLGGQWVSMYERFCWPVSSQRCLDRANFLAHIPGSNPPLQYAAQLSLEQVTLYGDALRATVHRDTRALAYTLNQVATLEDLFVRAVEQGTLLLRELYRQARSTGAPQPPYAAQAQPSRPTAPPAIGAGRAWNSGALRG